MTKPHLRYNGLNEVLKGRFGGRVYRVTLNLGLSCPNADGTRAKGGCYFCNDDALLAKSWHKQQGIEAQLDYGLDYLRWRHGAAKALAYFQNGTNTHASADWLRPRFLKVLERPELVGIVISTRPDCLGEDIIALLSELNARTYLWVDIGLQSAQDRVLERVNRAHTVAEFVAAVRKLADRGIASCAHVILGMPGETEAEMLAGADFLNGLPVRGVKIHNLLVTRDTVLEKWYREGLYAPLSLEDYARLCADYVERLRPDIVVHRLNAHAPARLTVAPRWSVNKLGVLNAIHAEMERRGARQGRLWAVRGLGLKSDLRRMSGSRAVQTLPV